MRTHTEPSPSSLARAFACPGSVRRVRSLPDEAFTTSPAAEEGTLAAKHAEEFLRTGVWCDTIDPEMRDHLFDYVTLVRNRADVQGASLSVELRVDLEPIAPAMHGTADAIVWSPSDRLLSIIDLKYGRGVEVTAGTVESPNSQLMAYALGACLSMEIRPAKVEIIIVQPRRFSAPSVCVIPMVRLLEWAIELENLLVQVEREDAPLSPGEKQCRFCAWAPRCGALQEYATRSATSDFTVAGADMEELARRYEEIPTIRAYCSMLESSVLDLAKKGSALPGYKVVETMGNRKWISETLVVERLGQVDPDMRFLEQRVRTPAQVEKLLGKDIVASLTTREVCGLKLVRENDNRETVAAKAESEFTKV